MWRKLVAAMTGATSLVHVDHLQNRVVPLKCRSVFGNLLGVQRKALIGINGNQDLADASVNFILVVSVF